MNDTKVLNTTKLSQMRNRSLAFIAADSLGRILLRLKFVLIVCVSEKHFVLAWRWFYIQLFQY